MSKQRRRAGGRAEDLSKVKPAELEARLRSLRAKQAGLDQEINEMRDEQQSLRLMSTVLMGEFSGLEQLPETHKLEMKALHAVQSEIDGLRKQRDLINQHVVLPEQAILENLYMNYFRLTGEEPELRYPSLKKEIEMFRRFFELQAMYFRKLEGTEFHREYQKLLKQHLVSIEQLEQTLQQDARVKNLASKTSKQVEGPLEFKIRKLGSRLHGKHKSLHRIKGERNRIEAFLGKTGRHRTTRRNMPDLSQLQQKISDGESLSLDDLGALLQRGGIDKLVSSKTQESTKKESKTDSTQPSRVKTRRGNRRGGPRSQDHREK